MSSTTTSLETVAVIELTTDMGTTESVSVVVILIATAVVITRIEL